MCRKRASAFLIVFKAFWCGTMVSVFAVAGHAIRPGWFAGLYLAVRQRYPSNAASPG